MTDHLLNNVRDLLTGSAGQAAVEIEMRAHAVTDPAATEILGHLDEGWAWRSKAAGRSTQWLEGRHLDSGMRLVLFLATEPVTRVNTARGDAIIAAANLTSVDA